ncbi:hypothetical protein [Candidatus Aalborgicola defluviihabitans]|uniref:hypothetical protein n=1 Tax=Candidatus Aalborgicola defluviihabitans TaxID=3386187 RepID=UPI00390A1DCC|nr:hypothetical protein [Burkholderiales bacterium]
MTIELNLANLIYLLFALVGAFWALVKVIISQYEKSLDTRFSALSLTIEKDQEVTRRLERDFLRMQADLPLHYVRREDYIRGQSVIEAKLDGLGTKVENALLRFFQNTT